MKRITQCSAAAAIVAVLASPGAYLAGLIRLEACKVLLLAATILWFAAAAIIMSTTHRHESGSGHDAA